MYSPHSKKLINFNFKSSGGSFYTFLLLTVNTQLKNDAAGNKIILPITTSKKRATTTFTSNAVSTVLNVTCSSGRL